MQRINGKSVFSVSEVNKIARANLENLSFWVLGEIFSLKGLSTNYRYVYFDLKDPQTGYKLSCIMEPDIFSNLDQQFSDGDSVIALGNLTLWEKDARFQMYVHKLEMFGVGILLEQIEKLKRKLEKKGYFKTNRKKKLMPFPTKIALIASQNSNAMHDFLRHSKEMYPILEVDIFDVVTQGSQAAAQIALAIKKVDALNFDVIAVVRGGGSLEDLASFNDELLAKAIFNAKTCIVAGVGHEKDVTIAQLVADIAASTPTDAAKIITKDYFQVIENLDKNLQRLLHASSNLFSSVAKDLDAIYSKLIFLSDKFRELPLRLKICEKGLQDGQSFYISQNENKLKVLWEKLNLLSPEKVLERGYSITTDKDGKIIKDSASVSLGAKIGVKLEKGQIKAEVTSKM